MSEASILCVPRQGPHKFWDPSSIWVSARGGS